MENRKQDQSRQFPRRALLKGAGIAAAGLAVAGAYSFARAGEADALLLGLCAELRAKTDYLNATKGWSDERADYYCDNILEPIERRIAATPAKTMRGLQAKFRIMAGYYDPLPHREDDALDIIAWRSLARDIERMAGRMA